MLVSRRFFVGALIATIGLGAAGLSPQAVQAGATFPGFPVPISGLSKSQALTLARKNPKVVANIAKKVRSIYSSGGHIDSASYDPATGILLIFWTTNKGVSRVTDDIFTHGVGSSS